MYDFAITLYFWKQIFVGINFYRFVCLQYYTGVSLQYYLKLRIAVSFTVFLEWLGLLAQVTLGLLITLVHLFCAHIILQLPNNL